MAVDPTRVNREISQAEIDDIAALVRSLVPRAEDRLRRSDVCI